MQTTPFKRANMMMAAISAILATTAIHLQSAELAKLGSYISRGHGRGSPSKRYGNACTNWQERLGDTMNGKRAVARRLSKIAKPVELLEAA